MTVELGLYAPILTGTLYRPLKRRKLILDPQRNHALLEMPLALKQFDWRQDYAR